MFIPFMSVIENFYEPDYLWYKERMDKLSVLVELVFQRRGKKRKPRKQAETLGCNQSAKCHQEA